MDALVLSPCCLRGALGAKITKVARADLPTLHDGAYKLLVATLAALCRSEMAPRAHVAAPSADPPTADATAHDRPDGVAVCQPCDEQPDCPSGGDHVSVVYDEAVLSPKNAFIVICKPTNVAAIG